MEYKELIKERYSVRSLDGTKVVEEEKINAILEAAQVAPTAVNKQPFHIWVIRSEENISKLCEASRFDFGAKLFFVVGSDAKNAWVRKYDQKNYADIDASIVATHMMLKIHDLGLGSTWVGAFDAPKVKELFPEMADYELVAIFPVGYLASGAEPSPRHGLRREISDFVDEL